MTGDLDAEHYQKNSKLQHSLAQKPLEAYSFRGDEIVLDVGCGDGKITAQLSQKVPKGVVIGIDKSPSMIALAKENYSDEKYPNLVFEVQDAVSAKYPMQFDLVTSFSCLHWIKNQHAALRNIASFLKPSGKCLILTYPRVPTFWDPIEWVADLPKWSGYFKENPRPYHFFSAKEYERLLPELGLEITQFEILSHVEKFEGKKGYENYVRGWLPFLIYLPKQLHDEFLDEIGTKSLEFAPLNADGYVYHPCETFIMTLEV
jgi:ubiquinone/menaquinone biosynthesis C-methylase UbiE